MEFHREMALQDMQAQGTDPAEATFASKRAFGSVALAQNRARDVWIWPWAQDAAQDVRFATRLLVKDCWFTSAAVFALALAMALASVVFTFVNALVVRGLPIADADRVMYIGMRDIRQRDIGVSYLDYKDWREASQSFKGLAAFGSGGINVGDPGQPSEQFSGLYVSANAFQVLGVAPVLGRDFLPEDDRPGSPSVVILASAVWKTRYGADPSIIGRSLAVNGSPTVRHRRHARWLQVRLAGRGVAAVGAHAWRRRSAKERATVANSRPDVPHEPQSAWASG